MQTTLSMLSDCSGVDGPSVYEEDFERPFLEETRQFYRVESQDFISRNTCPDYMRKVSCATVVRPLLY
jgi:cullin 3